VSARELRRIGYEPGDRMAVHDVVVLCPMEGASVGRLSLGPELGDPGVWSAWQA
jgi:hypothetical protein